MTFLGLRMYKDPQKQPKSNAAELDARYNAYFKLKFYSYVVYLLVSKYYSDYLTARLAAIKEEAQFSDKDWGALFEFRNDDAKTGGSQAPKQEGLAAEDRQGSQISGLRDSLTKSGSVLKKG